MPASRTVQIAGRPVTVRELTFVEVRAWMLECESSTVRDPLHALALEDCGLDDLAHMCDVDADALERLGGPSDIAPLRDACKELNPHFFKVRAALSRVAQLIKAETQRMTSTAPPASS